MPARFLVRLVLEELILILCQRWILWLTKKKIYLVLCSMQSFRAQIAHLISCRGSACCIIPSSVHSIAPLFGIEKHEKKDRFASAFARGALAKKAFFLRTRANACGTMHNRRAQHECVDRELVATQSLPRKASKAPVVLR